MASITNNISYIIQHPIRSTISRYLEFGLIIQFKGDSRPPQVSSLLSWNKGYGIKNKPKQNKTPQPDRQQQKECLGAHTRQFSDIPNTLLIWDLRSQENGLGEPGPFQLGEESALGSLEFVCLVPVQLLSDVEARQ